MKSNNNYDETRNRILSAAKDHFLKNGYEATRLEDIVRQAHVSKTSIYKIFGGKRELFQAFNEHFLNEHLSIIKTSKPDHPRNLDDVKSGLLKFSKVYMRIITNKERLALLRLNISLANTFNKSAIDFYHAGPNAIERLLTDYFTEIKSLRLLKIEDEKTAANQLTSLLRGNYHFKGLLDTQFEPCLQALEDHILNAVSFFLKGYEI